MKRTAVAVLLLIAAGSAAAYTQIPLVRSYFDSGLGTNVCIYRTAQGTEITRTTKSSMEFCPAFITM